MFTIKEKDTSQFFVCEAKFKDCTTLACIVSDNDYKAHFKGYLVCPYDYDTYEILDYFNIQYISENDVVLKDERDKNQSDIF